MNKYICGYCGKAYDKIEDRMNCESRCARENAKKKRAEEIASLKNKINELRNKESEMVTKLQSIRGEIRKAESKVEALNAKPESCSKKCKNDGEPAYNHDFYLNGLDELIKAILG